MTTKPHTIRPIPAGYHSVTPWIISRDTAKLIDFMTQAFGAQEIARIYAEDGSIGHAEVKIGDSIVMPFDAKKDWPETPTFLRLYIDDGDAVFQRALQAGATSVTEMTNLPWGDRVGCVRDPLGNLWWIMTHQEDVDQEEMARRSGEKEYIEAMQYVQSAQFFPPDRFESKDQNY
jgi:PhnB protein